MYDQGQLSTGLYNQYDDEKRPIMVLNEPCDYLRVPREVDWNPKTLLQITQSEYTHVPSEPLWSQEPLHFDIDPKRVVYPVFMVQRPYYQEPVTQRESLMFLNSTTAAGQGGASLYSKDLGPTRAIRSSTLYVNTGLKRTIQTGMVSGMRITDYQLAFDSLNDYNPDLWLALYSKYSAYGRGIGYSDFNGEIRPKLGLKGTLHQLLDETENRYYDSFNNVQSMGGRKQAFAELGVRMNNQGFLNEIQSGTDRASLFFFWICMPHAASQEEASTDYDKMMFLISNFVLTGRWVSMSEVKDGMGFVSPHYTNTQKTPLLQTAINAGVNKLGGALGVPQGLTDQANRYLNTAMGPGGKDAADALFANASQEFKNQLNTAVATIQNATGVNWFQ
jgi:hypothetical protein